MIPQRAVVCLGETLVDFVCEQPVDDVAAARSFTPFFGGSQANVAVGAARFGADTMLVGGAGDDPWGRWLRDSLAAEDVNTTHFALVEGAQTAHAFVTVTPDGEPSFSFFGDGGLGIADGAERLESVFAAGRGVLVFGSDTLIGKRERQVTQQARRQAMERGWDLVFDPNLRPARWAGERLMLETAAPMLAGCAIVKANLAEANALTGRSGVEEAALGLRELGAEAAVVTMGADGIAVAAADGELARVPARPARVVDATGAGDAVAAVLAAALAAGAERSRLLDIVALAAETAARIVEVRGALTGLPPPNEARAALKRTLAS
jgi:fructokinase